MAIFDFSKPKYEAVWTGEWPALCCGIWELYFYGNPIETEFPFGIDRPADTYGEYRHYYYSREVGDEVIDYYTSGLQEDQWIKQYYNWLNTFANPEDFSMIFKSFQKNDWRHGECGGCI